MLNGLFSFFSPLSVGLAAIQMNAKLLAMQQNELHQSALSGAALSRDASSLYAGLLTQHVLASRLAQPANNIFASQVFPWQMTGAPSPILGSHDDSGISNIDYDGYNVDSNMSTPNNNNHHHRLHHHQMRNARVALFSSYGSIDEHDVNSPMTSDTSAQSLSSCSSSNKSMSPSLMPSLTKTFTCKTCYRSFGYKHVLQNHERTHTGEKPFACKMCEKRFTRDHHLKTHMRLHTGEKPYHCDFCDRQFVQVANLRRHLRVHTGEKPNVCELCNARFSDSNQLKAHRSMHENEPGYVPATPLTSSSSSSMSSSSPTDSMPRFGRPTSLQQMYESHLADTMDRMSAITADDEMPLDLSLPGSNGSMRNLSQPSHHQMEPEDLSMHMHSANMRLNISDDYDLDTLDDAATLNRLRNHRNHWWNHSKKCYLNGS